MLTIEELNRNWEAGLTGFNAETWARMKAVGATAGWEAAQPGPSAVRSSAAPNLGAPVSSQNDFLEFVVRFRGNELVREARNDQPVGALVAGTLFRAARMLESLGVQVIPR